MTIKLIINIIGKQTSNHIRQISSENCVKLFNFLLNNYTTHCNQLLLLQLLFKLQTSQNLFPTKLPSFIPNEKIALPIKLPYHLQLEQKKIINNKYCLIKKLKLGGFASVYYAKDLEQIPNKYAIKLMPKKHQRYAKIQNKIYQLIKDKKFTLGFIKLYQTGIIDDQIFLVMELIGYDLQQIQQRINNKKFTLKTVLMIALQVIDRIQALHSIGYIHRDIKPDNIAIGIKQKSSTIYLLDFGLVLKHNAPIPNEQKGKIVGTLGYMSLRAHESKKPTYWDDIQSLIYTLIFMLQGTLPWIQINIKNSSDYHRVKIMKQKLDQQWFKKHNIPIQFYQILSISRKSNSSQQIDYLSIKYKILSILKQINQKNDFVFDWANLIRITHQSPNKKIQEKNNVQQSNQKLIQKQIFQIYKFIDQQGGINKNNIFYKNQSTKKNNYTEKRKNTLQNPKKPEQLNKNLSQNINTLKNRNIRPNSAHPNRNESKKKQQSQFMTKFGKQMKLIEQMKFGGPKIVINRTTAYQL